MITAKEVTSQKTKKHTETIRIILDKPRGEKIMNGIWSFFKVAFVAVFIFSLFATAKLTVPESYGIQKTYFDGYFRTTLKDVKASEVAVISLFGELHDTPQSSLPSEQGVTTDDIIFLLAEAVDDENIKAVLLRIDSPGGAVLSAEKIGNMVENVRKVKPVFTLIEGSGTSAAYYISALSDKIFSYPSSLLGNIGVLIMLPKVENLMEKIGVEMRLITSGKFKDMGSPFRDLEEKEKILFEDLIQESYNIFIGVVAKGRNMSIEKVKELADGRIYSGIQAKENGLIDATVGSFQEALEMVSKEIDAEKVQPVLFEIPLTPWEEILLSAEGGNFSLEEVTSIFGDNILGNGPRLLSK